MYTPLYQRIRLFVRRFRPRKVWGLTLLGCALRVGLYSLTPLPVAVQVTLALGDVLLTATAGEQLLRMDNVHTGAIGSAKARLG